MDLQGWSRFRNLCREKNGWRGLIWYNSGEVRGIDWSPEILIERSAVSRRLKLEEMLTSEPNDPFLNYAYALELVKEDSAAGLQRLAAMNEQFPDHVPAFFRRGQVLAETGDVAGARQVLMAGIQTARRVGDDHAAGEMNELLESL